MSTASSRCQSAQRSDAIPFVLRSDPVQRYVRRAARLRKLAAESTMADYLCFSASLVDAQREVCQHFPLASAAIDTESMTIPPADDAWLDNPWWQEALNRIIDNLLPDAPAQVRPRLETLRNSAVAERRQWAVELLSGNYHHVDSANSLFIWSALSVYWTQAIASITSPPEAAHGVPRHLCPLCGSPPVASSIQQGERHGLRYLHCSLCECEWHKVRAVCSFCPDDQKVEYWSLDDAEAAVKAESCDNCHGYLKICYPEKESEVEVVADDLASLVLDMQLEEQGYSRSGINPLLLPGEAR